MEAGQPGKAPAEPATEATKGPAGPRPSHSARANMLRWGLLALAVIVALIAWLATRGGSSSAPSTPPARIVSAAQLREAAATLGQPIYWAGPIPGREMQLKELGEGGGVQVLYLPQGAAAGRGSSNALTIGSYPLPDPKGVLQIFARRPGAIVRHARGGREVVAGATSPTSVYFAAADNSVQVEVYDPSPKLAMSLALSAKVQPAR